MTMPASMTFPPLFAPSSVSATEATAPPMAWRTRAVTSAVRKMTRSVHTTSNSQRERTRKDGEYPHRRGGIRLYSCPSSLTIRGRIRNMAAVMKDGAMIVVQILNVMRMRHDVERQSGNSTHCIINGPEFVVFRCPQRRPDQPMISINPQRPRVGSIYQTLWRVAWKTWAAEVGPKRT
jgi:hypothetical protein